MSNLVNITNQKATTTSRQIAENFGREHKNVLRDIESIQKDLLNSEPMFFETTEPDSYGRDQKVYIMNRDGFTLLAMGFTGSDALQWKIKYIQAFNEMEKQLSEPKQLSKIEILKMAMESEQKVLELQTTLESQKSKVVFAESVECSKSSILVKGLSVILSQNGIDIGQNRLFTYLRDEGYLCKQQGRNYNKPTQRSMDLKIMQEKTTTINKPDREPIITNTPLITGKGILFFVNKFLTAKNVQAPQY
jgi:anti-repressor protein